MNWFTHRYPYSNLHELNLDWIIDEFVKVHKELEDTIVYVDEGKLYIDGKLADATQQAEFAELAKQAAQAAQTAAENAQTAAEVSQTAAANSATASANSAIQAATTVANTVSQINTLQSRVDNIIPDGTQTEGNTELLDIRVGADGITYSSAGNSVRGQCSDLTKDVNYIGSTLNIKLNQIRGGFKQGFYANADGTYNPNRQDYVCTVKSIAVTAGDILTFKDFPYAGIFYIGNFDSNMDYIDYSTESITLNGTVDHVIGSGISYIQISFTRGGGTTLIPAEYANAKVTINDGLNDVEINTQDINYIYGNVSDVQMNTSITLQWIDGESISNVDGSVVENASFHRTDYVEIPDNCRICFKNVGGGSTIYNAWYDEDKTFIASFRTTPGDTITIMPPTDAKYMRLSFISTTKNTANAVPFLNVDYNRQIIINNGLVEIFKDLFTNLIYYYGSGVWGTASARVGMRRTYTAKSSYKVSIATGYKYSVHFFNDPVPSSSSEVSSTGWTTGITTVHQGDIVLINVAKTDDSNVSADAAENLLFIPIIEDNVIGSNYVVGSDLMKRAVTITSLGTLTYLQAFCLYNGSYYSINGDNISVQDSSFVETANTTLDTGHGNSLQLGNSKYAYASGWDDNKIYKVDLENLVVDSVITLPTTGYTTGVVDEVRNYAYIFQRDTYPSTEDNYNFIVYDITNQTIVSTKKLLSFGAMQAADFYNDRIIVLNGLGNDTCPNGYRVFDTNGNILADYHLGTFSTSEPEGVCVNRSNQELLISLVDSSLYKVTI